MSLLPSVMMSEIKLDETGYGLLYIDSIKSSAFWAHERNLFKILSEQLTLALKKSFLYEQISSKQNESINILSNIASGVITINSSGIITSMNQAAAALLGFNREVAVNSDYQEIFEFLREGDLLSLIKNVFETGKTISRQNVKYTTFRRGEIIVDLLITELKDIRIKDVWINDCPGEMIYTNSEPDYSLFSNSELKILTTIKELFSEYSAKEISDFSHKEKGYQETPEGELIPFRYAESLQDFGSN